ncbi:hypothetical protein D3C83_291920 [compost metagenome]
MPGEQGFLVVGRQLAVVRNADIVVVGNQVEDVFLEVRPGAADGMDLVPADHFCE